MSISAERVYLAASGMAAQETVGPKQPKLGPPLPIADKTVVADSAKPTPKADNRAVPPVGANKGPKRQARRVAADSQ